MAIDTPKRRISIIALLFFGLAAIAVIAWMMQAPDPFPGLGQQAALTDGFVGCRDLQDVKTFDGANSTARLAHDSIGAVHALTAAEAAGCISTSVLRFAGDANVIDQDGDYYRVRFDRSGAAWWTIGEVLKPPTPTPSAKAAAVGASKQATRRYFFHFRGSGPSWQELRVDQHAYTSSDSSDYAHAIVYMTENDLVSMCGLRSSKHVKIPAGELVEIKKISLDDRISDTCEATAVEIDARGKDYWVNPSLIYPVFPMNAVIAIGTPLSVWPHRGSDATFEVPDGTKAKIIRQDESPRSQRDGELYVEITQSSDPTKIGMRGWVFNAQTAGWWMPLR